MNTDIQEYAFEPCLRSPNRGVKKPSRKVTVWRARETCLFIWATPAQSKQGSQIQGIWAPTPPFFDGRHETSEHDPHEPTRLRTGIDSVKSRGLARTRRAEKQKWPFGVDGIGVGPGVGCDHEFFDGRHETSEHDLTDSTRRRNKTTGLLQRVKGRDVY